MKVGFNTGKHESTNELEHKVGCFKNMLALTEYTVQVLHVLIFLQCSFEVYYIRFRPPHFFFCPILHKHAVITKNRFF